MNFHESSSDKYVNYVCSYDKMDFNKINVLQVVW
jgi:hypothetical protein